MALTLLGGLAKEHLTGVCEHHATGCLTATKICSVPGVVNMVHRGGMNTSSMFFQAEPTGKAATLVLPKPIQDFKSSEKDYKYTIKADSDIKRYVSNQATVNLINMHGLMKKKRKDRQSHRQKNDLRKRKERIDKVIDKRII